MNTAQQLNPTDHETIGYLAGRSARKYAKRCKINARDLEQEAWATGLYAQRCWSSERGPLANYLSVSIHHAVVEAAMKQLAPVSVGAGHKRGRMADLYNLAGKGIPIGFRSARHDISSSARSDVQQHMGTAVASRAEVIAWRERVFTRMSTHAEALGVSLEEVLGHSKSKLSRAKRLELGAAFVARLRADDGLRALWTERREQL